VDNGHPAGDRPQLPTSASRSPYSMPEAVAGIRSANLLDPLVATPMIIKKNRVLHHQNARSCSALPPKRRRRTP
jgi:hypothetical protein